MDEFLYKPYGSELTVFGAAWCGPEVFEPWKDTLVAKYEATPKGDGQTVEVYCAAAPTRFYTLKVLAGPNSLGDEQPSYAVNFGSGMAELAAKLAEEIARGMVGFVPAPPTGDCAPSSEAAVYGERPVLKLAEPEPIDCARCDIYHSPELPCPAANR